MKLARWFLAVAVVAYIGAAAWPALGAGILVPTDQSLPPLAVKFLRVDTTIDNQVATTHVTQEFQNSTDRPLECTYIFPLPKGAAIREFAMYINGTRMVGELVEKEKARQVFEEIVRRAKDPGLLEYMDSTLLRLKIFPVPAKGTQKVELEYTELIPAEGGLAEYIFPLKMGDKASKTLDDFTVAVKIKSSAGITSVYSPTHEVGVSKKSDHEAVAGMEAKGATLDRDFHLFYTLSDKDFGLSLMTYRPDAAKPGMFMILLSPKTDMDESRSVPRDVVFVLDTSGSMAGEKIAQVKKALEFCLGKLEAKDRFAIVQFSTSTETLADGWLAASEDNVKKARAFTDKLEAAGGTNIGEALEKVFALPQDEGHLTTVLFLTDGRPTVGTTEPDALVKAVKDNNKRGLRVFTFGVGDDVNTHLLDRIAAETGGLPEYVRQGDTIDLKVTRLFSKMSHPVLTDLAIEIPGVKIVDMYPKQAPDLFRGGQVVLIGSYEGDGASAIRLKGHNGKKTEEFVYEGTFPKMTADRGFIGPLYANRKIGYLLDQIRLHGEDKELHDEVVRLSLAYGIETPYTSYLVLENDQQYKQYGITRQEDRISSAPVMAAGGEKAAERVRTEFAAAKSPGDVTVNANVNSASDLGSASTAVGGLSGAGGFVKSGGGTVVLNGANTNYSGGTAIQGGTLTVNNGASTGTFGGANQIGGATGISNGMLKDGAAAALPSTQSLSIRGGTIAGGGALTLNGGTLTAPPRPAPTLPAFAPSAEPPAAPAVAKGADETRPMDVLGVGGGGNRIGGIPGGGDGKGRSANFSDAGTTTIASGATIDADGDAETTGSLVLSSTGGAMKFEAEQKNLGKAATATFHDDPTAAIPAKKVSGVHATAEDLKKQDTGKVGVDIAEEVKRMREASTGRDVQGTAAVQEKAGHRFLSFHGVWVDERFQGTEKLTKIKWGSDAYFRLVREKADWRDIFTMGQRLIIVTARGQAVAVDADVGEEKLTDEAFKALFTDLPAEKPVKAEEKPAK